MLDIIAVGDLVQVISNTGPVVHYLKIPSTARVTRINEDYNTVDVQGPGKSTSRGLLYQVISMCDIDFPEVEIIQ